MRVAAIDWSGARQRPGLWVAAIDDGVLDVSEPVRSREDVVDLVANADVVGLDFAFSLPDWFLAKEGIGSAPELWSADREAWLRDRRPPFWGWPGSRKPAREDLLRRTERQVEGHPKSVFQILGPGAVGTGSIRGFPILRRLRGMGFSIWPFDPPRLPVVVEIWPRLLFHRPVRKRRREERLAYLEERGLPPGAAETEDSFDAVVSAFRMWEHREELASLEPAPDIEGRIWQPGVATFPE